MTEADLRERLARLFARDGQLHERFSPPNGTITTIIPETAWEALILPDRSAVPCLLRLYAVNNGNALLERFWRNEARSLHRLSSRRHPSLPKLRAAALVRDLGLGFVVIDDPGIPLDDANPRLEALRSDQVLVVRTFLEVAEALAALHAEGLVHRNLTLSRLAWAPEGDVPIVLDGFQFSAFLASWLRRHDAPTDAGGRPFLPESPTELVCLPPERLRSLQDGGTRHLESVAGDVFSLGMIVTNWLAGPSESSDVGLLFAGNRYDPSAHARIVLDASRRLRDARVPTALCRLLDEMTSISPANRIPSGPEAVATLARIFPTVLAEIDIVRGTPPARPHHVYFLPETVRRIYQDGARSSPENLDEREYAEFIERDLVGGLIVWAPKGFEPWTNDDLELARRATIVLLGQRYAYFSEYLNQGRANQEGRVLLIKFAIPVNIVAELRGQPRRQECPPISASLYKFTGRPPLVQQNAPPWTPIASQIRFTEERETGSPVLATAEWLLGYQEASLSVQEYAFERLETDGEPGTRPLILRSMGAPSPFDPSKEQSAFAELFRRSGLVQPMGLFFKQAAEQGWEDGDQLEFRVRGEKGDDINIRLILEEKLDDHTVRFRPHPGEELVPIRGRVRPDDEAARIILSRQRRAVRELGHSTELLSQFREVRGIKLAPPEQLAGVAHDLKDSPDAARIIRRIIDEEPFFALQGPPGTGKTFIGSHVVKEVLAADPFARILVSSQSNAATDNILEAVVRCLGLQDDRDDPNAPLILRYASVESEARCSDDAKPFLVSRQATRAREIAAGAKGAASPLDRIQKAWSKSAKDQSLDAELYVRLQRAANLVFATCAGAGANVEALRGSSGFDWVVVEEAAKAWLTEVVVPLVQGDRWLLIGDQQQLPAFARDEVESLARLDIQDRLTATSTGRIPTESMIPYLSYFKHVMEAPPTGGAWTTPRDVMTEQRRMHPDIGGLIGSAFYFDKLNTHRSASRSHEVTGISAIERTALLWVDTTSFGPDGYDRGRENLQEVKLLKFLLGRLRGFKQHDTKIPPVLVLSPYRKQLTLLKERIRTLSPNDFRTVDAVQGREAEVVIVSLVRHNANESQSSALGFLQAPERVNVMFSRARRLLLILGSLSHFERFGDAHWGKVAKYVRSDSRFIVDASRDPIGFSPRGVGE